MQSSPKSSKALVQMNKINLELIYHTEFKIWHLKKPGRGGIEYFSNSEKLSIFQTSLSPQCLS